MRETKSLIGIRFGKLVVLSREEGADQRYARWLCQCDCGNRTVVNTRRLKRSVITNCGCEPKKTAQRGNIAEDLKGKRFGYLTVIRRAENKKNKTRWLCQCDCGNTKECVSSYLKLGKVKSCGCRSHSPLVNFTDIKGKKIGEVTVLEPTTRRDYKGSIIWKCRCICGNTFETSSDDLLHGNRKSCGCMKAEWTAGFMGKSFLTFVDGTCVEWLKGRKSRNDNTSGFRGVSQTKYGTWRVNIGFRKKRYYLGCFDTYDEAVQTRLKAEEQFHNNFVRQYENWKHRAENNPEWEKQNPFRFETTF